jgi:ubiquitin-conjugating enzyme E2 variant
MDNTFTHWTASILSPQDRFYELQIECGINYPVEPPKLKFISQINMTGVGSRGEVDNKHFFKKWNRDNTMQWCLQTIKKEMETTEFKNKKQPKDDSRY